MQGQDSLAGHRHTVQGRGAKTGKQGSLPGRLLHAEARALQYLDRADLARCRQKKLQNHDSFFAHASGFSRIIGQGKADNARTARSAKTQNAITRTPGSAARAQSAAPCPLKLARPGSGVLAGSTRARRMAQACGCARSTSVALPAVRRTWRRFRMAFRMIRRFILFRNDRLFIMNLRL